MNHHEDDSNEPMGKETNNGSKEVHENGGRTTLTNDEASSVEFAPYCSDEEEHPSTRTVTSHDHLSSAFIFASRICLISLLSAAFVLLFPLSNPWPEAIWIVVTATVVSWLPRLDTATAIQKVTQRCIGTILGAFMGIGFGFLSTALLEQNSTRSQAIFLGAVLGLESFLFPYFVERKGYRENYAALLTQVTFGLVLLSFYVYEEEDVESWERGISRIYNVFIGCTIGAICCLIIRPMSTKQAIIETLVMQMRSAGLSAERVFRDAYGSFADQEEPERFADLFNGRIRVHENTYSVSVGGLDAWKECQALMARLKYDPIFKFKSDKERVVFLEHAKMIAGRTFLLQSNIIMLDTLVRGGLSKFPSLSSIDFEIMLEIGKKIRKILDVSSPAQERESACEVVAGSLLGRLRERSQYFRNLDAQRRGDRRSVSKIMEAWMAFDGTRPLESLEDIGQIILFFELTEHLLLRSIRQYAYWESNHAFL